MTQEYDRFYLIPFDRTIGYLAAISEDVVKLGKEDPMNLSCGYSVAQSACGSAIGWMLKFKREIDELKHIKEYQKEELDEFRALFGYDLEGYSKEQIERIKQFIATIDAEVDKEIERLEKECK